MSGERLMPLALLAALGPLLAACSSSPTPTPAAPETPAPPATSAATAPSAPASHASGTTAGPVRTTSGGLGRCRTSRLTVTLGEADGTAGSGYRQIIFTNRGPASCTLHGHPGVSYVAGDDGHQVGAAAEWQGGSGPAVILAPGDRAQAQLQQIDVLNYDPAACRPVPVRGLRVYPPGEKAAVYLPAPGTGCSGSPPGPQLAVRAVTSP